MLFARANRVVELQTQDRSHPDKRQARSLTSWHYNCSMRLISLTLCIDKVAVGTYVQCRNIVDNIVISVGWLDANAHE